MKHIIEILRNLGKIVILLFQIGYVSIIDYMSLFDKPKPKQSDTKNKTATSNNKDVCWDSSQVPPNTPIDYPIKDEVVHERPHYKN